ncbi:ROK family transcriptional regulator [Chelatococcus asaccharovorans]|uniref:Putative NBD/HSP70 family sugar kinase n=1 Tax=Chelatococcus asaccharovorans TaxID=28210 RepID=A0A2V3UAE3_9HYPH|nr:ROK family transcriptional regulator [Chelatococcus asaccharovorans]MBS7705216.1 ROK family transcriptional regulator [Chelatococcus asaccharovorans]PXW60380.1 putative NBD/HSP70 family sugar kinase [Chelatococcus asaccharovorans]
MKALELAGEMTGMSVSGLAPFDRRGHNRRVILDALRRQGAASRAELAATTGLSAQTLSSIADDLCREGLLKIVGRRASARGQPPIDLAINRDGGFAVGIHVEHGRLTGVLADLGAEIRDETVLSCDTATPETAIGAAGQLVERLVSAAAIDRARLWGVGIVLPGPFGPIDLLPDPLSMAAWSRADFSGVYAAALRLPVLVGNDATAAAIGEHLHGVARDLRSFVYLYIAEGIGGGVFVDGQPATGAFGNAGEIGRMVIGLAEDGRTPITLEDHASLDALRRRLSEAGSPDAAAEEGARLFAARPDIVADWRQSAARYLRMAIATVENLFDPETIVVGGPLPPPELKALIAALEPLLPTVSLRKDRAQPRVMMGSAGRASPALGGATLPLFRGLTPQPRAARVPKGLRMARQGAASTGAEIRTRPGATNGGGAR